MEVGISPRTVVVVVGSGTVVVVVSSGAVVVTSGTLVVVVGALVVEPGEPEVDGEAAIVVSGVAAPERENAQMTGAAMAAPTAVIDAARNRRRAGSRGVIGSASSGPSG
jgi:hypothetical protein